MIQGQDAAARLTGFSPNEYSTIKQTFIEGTPSVTGGVHALQHLQMVLVSSIMGPPPLTHLQDYCRVHRTIQLDNK
jgi:hypothetical protein